MKYIISHVALAVVLTALHACSDESETQGSGAIDNVVSEQVVFSGEVRNNMNMQTRAGEETDENIWLDITYDRWQWEHQIEGENQKAPIDFIIYQSTKMEDNTNVTEMGVYQIKNGEKNRLESVDKTKALNWKSKDAEHKFYAWTEPDGVTMTEDRTSGDVDMTVNNTQYEYFVGEITDPMTYSKHGVTVGLKFEHLISKLCVDRITLVEVDGSHHSDILWSKALAITFPNMPTSGTFTTGIKEGDDMKVVLNEKKKGISFHPQSDAYKSENGEYKTEFFQDGVFAIPFYMLPMKFDDGNDYGKFYVTVEHKHPTDTTNLYSNYEGNLKDLINEYTTPKLNEIKAGECLTMRLQLYDGKVTGYLVYIKNWNTDAPVIIKEKPYPGIYSTADLLHNKMELKEDRKWHFKSPEDLVDGITEDGKKIIKLYDNLDFENNSGTIVIPEGYVLDGLGHNITCAGCTFEGECKNIYINGEPYDSSL